MTPMPLTDIKRIINRIHPDTKWLTAKEAYIERLGIAITLIETVLSSGHVVFEVSVQTPHFDHTIEFGDSITDAGKDRLANALKGAMQ